MRHPLRLEAVPGRRESFRAVKPRQEVGQVARDTMKEQTAAAVLCFAVNEAPSKIQVQWRQRRDRDGLLKLERECLSEVTYVRRLIERHREMVIRSGTNPSMFWEIKGVWPSVRPCEEKYALNCYIEDRHHCNWKIASSLDGKRHVQWPLCKKSQLPRHRRDQCPDVPDVCAHSTLAF